LRYANPRDLPSFPSLGLSNGLSSAGAAASLASSPRKPIPRWKADPSPSAFAAAVHVKDLQSIKQWQPEPSTQGVKAALVAHARNSVKHSLSSNPTSPQGALSSQRLSPRSNYRITAINDDSSPQIVTGVTVAKRQRSRSAPTTADTTRPDLAYSAADALNAATTAHSPSVNRSNTVPQSATGGNYRQGVGSIHMLCKPETADGKGVDVRAAAVSMARQLSAIQRGSINDIEGLERDWNRLTAYELSVLAQSGEHVQAHSSKLQDAASKLAQERLARLHGEHEAHKDCFGLSHTQLSPPVRDVTRRRAFSLGKCVAQCGEQSRSEIPLLIEQATQLHAEKLEEGCKALIATAQKNVQASMRKMDEEILSQTGRLSPPTQEKWDALAIAAAEAESVNRMSNYGKIGARGGKFVAQGEANAATAKNIQPFFGEIGERPEKGEARKERFRLELKEKRRTIEEKLRAGARG
jgi:Eisosome protein 1